MSARDRLIELLENSEGAIYWSGTDKSFIEKIADYLIANGVTVNEWISVKDRLPEVAGYYMTCDKYGNIHTFFYSPGCKYPFYISPYDNRYYMPTHWMPLPEPPKKVNNGKID